MILKNVAAALCFLLVAPLLIAQEDDSLGGYEYMEIEAGRMKGNFAAGVIEEMTGDVRIRLLSEDPSVVPLPIRARVMRFTWAEGSTTPSVILMEGGVEVNHPDGSISAERAEWDFEKGELVFSGNPVMNSERLKGLSGEQLLFNLKTNTFEGTRIRADRVPLQRGESAATTATDALREQHITNWPRLIDTIKEEAQREAPTPGRQILAQLTQQNQQLLLSLETAMLVERKADMLRLMNSILPNPAFYNEAAWADRTLHDEAKQLLAEAPLESARQIRLNRLLFEAAYPFAFSTP